MNVVSDTISHSQIAKLLEQYTEKKVEVDVLGEEKMYEIWDDPSRAPKEHTESAFPVDFWYLVKGTQGKGEFIRPKSQIHNNLLKELTYTPLEGYFKSRSGSSEKL